MTTSTTPCWSAGCTTSRVPIPVLHRDRQPGAPGGLGVHLGQDLVLREVVGGEPDGRGPRRGRRRLPGTARAHREDAPGRERARGNEVARRAPPRQGSSGGNRSPVAGPKGMVARRCRVEHQPAWRRCRRHRPTRYARSRSSGRNHRRSSASAGGGDPRASRPHCPSTSTRPASGGWRLSAVVVALWIAVVVTGSVARFDVADTRVLQAFARSAHARADPRRRRSPASSRTGDGHLRPLAGQPR